MCEGSDEDLDDIRAAVVVRVLYYRRSPVVAFVRTVTSNMQDLLEAMSRHILAVRYLCQEVSILQHVCTMHCVMLY